MPNDFFNATGNPSDDSFITSPVIRAEFTAIAAGFAKLPTFAGNANKAVVVNSSATALDVTPTAVLQTSDLGVTVQAYDAQLADVAGLTPTDNGVVIGNGTNFVVESGSTLKTSLGLTIGTNVQAWSSNLDEYAAVNPTTAGLALLDDADATAQRATLGLGSLATQSGTFSGTSSGTNTGDNAVNSLYSGLVSNATHTGDVTGATTLTIANDAVTYAKMQNVSATDKLLGRSTAGAGDVEEIACTAAGRAILDDADATAQRATLGLVIGTNVQAYDADTAKLDVAQTFTAPQRGTQTTDNDGSFDLNATNNFKCTPTGAVAITFTNIASATGQSGNILLVNGSNHAITAAATTKAASGSLTTLSATGTYLIGYYCDGSNVYVGSTAALA